MLPATVDTIAAVASPPGRGAIGIVRVSGPRAGAIARALLRRLPSPRQALHSAFLGERGIAIDDGLALWFPGPASFTGEDVLELQGHGGPVVLDMLLTRVLGLGARLARPGEFSERAFLNGKLDLNQAEAIADLIDAASEAAARGATRALQGVFSERIHTLVAGLVGVRAVVEGSLDFPDEEDVGAISGTELAARIDDLLVQHDRLAAEAQQGAVLREGIAVAIVGAPNVGKSSLLNRLVGRDVAIVTDVPGTTRDLVRDSLQIEGVPLHLVDTAGLRSTTDPVEAIGIDRARAAAAAADLVLHVRDDRDRDAALTDPTALELGAGDLGDRVIEVRNKIDLSGEAPGARERAGRVAVCVSCTTGAGLEELTRVVLRRAGLAGGTEGLFVARRRHLEALGKAREALARARETASALGALELAADDLRLAQRALGEITGEFTTEDLLGEIFATFCIGK